MMHSNMVYPKDDDMLQKWQIFSMKKEGQLLLQWLRCNTLSELNGNQCQEKLTIKTPLYYGKLGIFITLKKGREVRGCYEECF